MKPLRRIWAAVKALTLRFTAGAQWGYSRYYGTNVDYAGAVSDGRSNSIVMAVVGWVARTFPEAPVEVRKVTTDGAEPVRGHALTRLLRRPNPYYTGELLWMATLADWMLTGNAYWVKRRATERGRVTELWWIPASQIEPAWPQDGSAFLSHYVYRVDGREQRIDVDDLVHFRYGLDPRNYRKGLSPLGAALREVYTDDEGAQYTATILRNLGIPGVVLSPGKDVEFTQEAADEVKAGFMARFGGDHRGEPLIMRGETNISVLSFNPEQMTLRDLRQIPEERLTAIWGVAAIVVGLGAGLARSTFSNFAEAREAAYEGNIIPTQRLFSGELETQLLPDFETRPDQFEVGFDISGIRVLQADEDKLVERSTRALLAGGLTVDEYRTLIGQQPLPKGQGEVLYVPNVVTVTAPADLAAPPAPVPTPLRALPEPAAASRARAERKSADDVVPALERARDAQVAPATTDLANYLVAQQNMVIAQLQLGSKAIRDVGIGDDETDHLRALLETYYRQLLVDAHAATQAGLGVAFGVPDALTTEYLDAAGRQIGGITETTRTAVAAALQEGQAAGEGIPELARRLRALPEFNRARATTIARTELANASIESAFTTYRASGVVAGVRVLDGDFDAECAARNGQTFSLDEARTEPRLLHPNCTAAWAPVTDASALRGVA